MSKRDSWASDDDANDLLAGILSDTEEEAAAEQQRIEAELKAREEEERRQKEEEEARRRAEAEARMTAEMDRQGDLEKRRTMRMEALRIEELKERGEWVDPEVKAAEEEAARREKEAEAARLAALAAERQAPTPEQQAQAQAAGASSQKEPAASKTPLIILGVVGALVVALAVVFVLLAQGGYEVDQRSYAKVVYQPKDPEVKLVTMSFSPLPKVEEEEEKEEPKPAARRTVRRAAPAKKAPAKKAPAKKKPKLDLDLSGADPFGAGF